MSSGERLAPVTWLFGTPTERAADQAGAADSSSALPGVAVAMPAGDDDEPVAAPGPIPQERPRTREEQPAGSFERINNVSMHALGRRGVSVAEMRRLLLAREFDDDEVNREIDRLLGVGLLDDARLAETLVRTLRERKGLGRTALASELSRRRLDQSVVAEALDDLADDELDRAIDIARRRAPQLRGVDREAAQRRLAGFLARKGYSGSIVRIAVERALRETDEHRGPVFR